LFTKKVQAQQSIRIDEISPTPMANSQKNLTFDPILRHLEGYAYDEKGQVIPKAKVEIRYTMNDKLFYMTTADDSGFFTIYKNNLPPLEYYLEFVDPVTQVKTKQTTSQFVKNNQSYIDSEKINLMAVSKNNQPIINPATGELNKIVKNTGQSPQNKPTSVGKNPLGTKFLMIIFILVVLFISTIGMIFYIRRNKFIP